MAYAAVPHESPSNGGLAAWLVENASHYRIATHHRAAARPRTREGPSVLCRRYVDDLGANRCFGPPYSDVYLNCWPLAACHAARVEALGYPVDR